MSGAASQIKEHMPVVGSDSSQFATVDHLEGQQWIKLTKDGSGQHHYIPISWVKKVEDGKVQIDKPASQASKEWSSQPPSGGSS